MKEGRIPVSGTGAGGKGSKLRAGGVNGVAVAVELADGGNGALKRRANGIGGGGGGTGRKKQAAAGYRRHQQHHPLRRRVMPSGPIQRLFEACKQVFKGPGTVPSPADVKALRDILDTMTVEDVGLKRDLPFFQPSSSSDESGESTNPRRPPMAHRKIIRTIIHNRKNRFELSIFLLPAGAVIPLHNHPGMTVFSKLLLGSMHAKSYDWVDPADDVADAAMVHDPQCKLRLAKLKADRDISAPCNTSVLYPTSGGNMHTFTAITPCVMLDVLGPPYSSEDGRDCSYYIDHPCASPAGTEDEEEAGHHGDEEEEEADRYALLEEVDEPYDLFDLLFYMGPQVMDC